MAETREPTVQVNFRVPESLHKQMLAAAQRYDIPLGKLIVIWVESQVSPGADVVLGKAHS